MQQISHLGLLASIHNLFSNLKYKGLTIATYPLLSKPQTQPEPNITLVGLDMKMTLHTPAAHRPTQTVLVILSKCQYDQNLAASRRQYYQNLAVGRCQYDQN